MSSNLKQTLQSISLMLSLGMSLAAGMGVWAVIPYRLTAAEKKIEQVVARHEADHDLLIRINSKLEQIGDRLGIRERKDEK